MCVGDRRESMGVYVGREGMYETTPEMPYATSN